MLSRTRGRSDNRPRRFPRPWSALACLTLFAGFVALAGPSAPRAAAAEATPKAGPTTRHVKLLAVGNSFSGNASKFLKDIVAASGNELTFGHASIGGCPLEKHWAIAEANDAKPNGPTSRPYAGMKPGSKATLKELLTAEKWDYVTLQQASIKSFEAETYQPFASNLAAYARQHAPTAEVVIHETWAYRGDDPLFKKEGMSQEKMYEGLKAAYAKAAGEIGARVIPVGDAFERARRDPAWQLVAPDPKFDYKNAVAPALPDQSHSLNVGWLWAKGKDGKQSLKYDGHHANVAGQYLGGAVWFEFLYGQNVVGNTFVPKGLTKEDVAFLQRVAHEAVKEPWCVPAKAGEAKPAEAAKPAAAAK